jgi:mycothiol S-conjugate amidase
VPLDIQEQVWPTEEYELADAAVPVEVPEDDLFAGIRDLAGSYDGRRESIAV